MKDVWTLRSELMGWIRDLVHAAPPLNLDVLVSKCLHLSVPPGRAKARHLLRSQQTFRWNVVFRLEF